MRSENLREAEIHLVAGGQKIFDAPPLAPQGEKSAAVQVPEHRLADAVFFKQTGEERLLPLDAEGRIVDERNERVPLGAHLVHLRKCKAEALRLAQVQLFVPLGEVGAARARPPARACDHVGADLYTVVLQEIKAVVGRKRAHARNAAPPIVMVPADEHLFAGERRKAGDVVHALFQFHAPRGIAADEHDILRRDLFPPIRGDFFKVPFPAVAENVHRLFLQTREVQIADRKHLHGESIP